MAKSKIVTVIFMELTYLSGGLIFAWIVEEWVWDYAIPVKLIHIDLTAAGSELVMMMEANDDGG